MDLHDAIDALIEETDEDAALSPARYARQAEGGGGVAGQTKQPEPPRPEGPEEFSPPSADSFPVPSLPSSPRSGSADLAPVSQPSLSGMASVETPSAPPVDSLDSLDAPERPESADGPELPSSEPPETFTPGPLQLTSPPSLQAGGNLPVPEGGGQEPGPTLSQSRPVTQPPEEDLSVATEPPAVDDHPEQVPSRYARPDQALEAPVASETLPAVELHLPSPPAGPDTTVIDEPEMSPAGLTTPEFAEQIGEIAAFKMAQREAEIVAMVQDEIEIKMSQIERRFSV